MYIIVRASSRQQPGGEGRRCLVSHLEQRSQRDHEAVHAPSGIPPAGIAPSGIPLGGRHIITDLGAQQRTDNQLQQQRWQGLCGTLLAISRCGGVHPRPSGILLGALWPSPPSGIILETRWLSLPYGILLETLWRLAAATRIASKMCKCGLRVALRMAEVEGGALERVTLPREALRVVGGAGRGGRGERSGGGGVGGGDGRGEDGRGEDGSGGDGSGGNGGGDGGPLARARGIDQWQAVPGTTRLHLQQQSAVPTATPNTAGRGGVAHTSPAATRNTEGEVQLSRRPRGQKP